MSTAEKRVRAYFKASPWKGHQSEKLVRAVTTGDGIFELRTDDIKYLAGERRRTCRELTRLVEDFEAETESDSVDTVWLKKWIETVAKR